MIKFFHTLFYFRLPSNVTVFSYIYLDQAHVLKAQDKCSQLLLFPQNQQIFRSVLFLVGEYHLITWVSKSLTISGQQRLLESYQAKTTFLSDEQHLIFLLFEDKGMLHAHHNGIKSRLLPGQSLSSELERGCPQ